MRGEGATGPGKEKAGREGLTTGRVVARGFFARTTSLSRLGQQLLDQRPIVGDDGSLLTRFVGNVL